MNDISAIVLTFNEELHIHRCLKNAFRVCKEVFVIDCSSTDKTVEIAKEMGAQLARLFEVTEKQRKEMGLKGQRFVRNNFSTDSVCRSLKSLYDWIIYNRERPKFVY